MPMKVVLEIDAENELVHSGFWLWVNFWLETLLLYEVGNNSYSYTCILAMLVKYQHRLRLKYLIPDGTLSLAQCFVIRGCISTCSSDNPLFGLITSNYLIVEVRRSPDKGFNEEASTLTFLIKSVASVLTKLGIFISARQYAYIR